MTIQTSDTNEALKPIAEYRNHMINEWANLLYKWLNLTTDQISVEMKSPDFNKDIMIFAHNELYIFTTFDWAKDRMIVSSSSLDTMGGYKVHCKTFKLINKHLANDKLYNFITRVRNEYNHATKLTAKDVIEITTAIKDNSPAFENEKAAKDYYFNTMINLMLLMQKKKYRRDHKLMLVYFCLVRCLWSSHKTEFMEFLANSENNKDKTEGNE